jgi:hypothetical protein
MFRILALKADSKHIAWAFCCGEHADCVRYKKTLAGEVVPGDMLPTGMTLLLHMSGA